MQLATTNEVNQAAFEAKYTVTKIQKHKQVNNNHKFTGISYNFKIKDKNKKEINYHKINIIKS